MVNRILQILFFVMLSKFYIFRFIFIFKFAGTFTLRPNPRNSRDLDFTIALRFDGQFTSLNELNTYRMR